jgi:ectoine hydroxylase-related dioxygenase (phytanoyl-CoA dioxygenase family)
MRELMGDEPILMEEKLNPKQLVDLGGRDVDFLKARSLADDHFPLHHDWGYYRKQGYPGNTVSSAIALDDCAGRGPIRVIPGSHRVDIELADPDPASGDGIVADGAVDPHDVVPVDAPAGAVVLFHAKLVHDSEPNLSGLPRRLMIYSHYPRSHDASGGDADRRNAPWRAAAQAFEQDYLDAVAAGTCPEGVTL